MMHSIYGLFRQFDEVADTYVICNFCWPYQSDICLLDNTVLRITIAYLLAIVLRGTIYTLKGQSNDTDKNLRNGLKMMIVHEEGE